MDFAAEICALCELYPGPVEFAPITQVLREPQGAAALSSVVPTLLGWGPGMGSAGELLFPGTCCGCYVH